MNRRLEPMNLTDYLLQNGGQEDIALTDGDGDHTYAELEARARAVAAALAELGLETGARVGLLAGNSLFWVVSYLAILRLGLVAVPVATVSSPSGVSRALEHVGCAAVLAGRDEAGLLGDNLPAGCILLAEEATAAPAAAWPPAPSVDPGADAVLAFTSGTTGTPRAVRVTHMNIQANTDAIIDYLGLQRDDRMLVVLPFYYCFGASLLHTHLRVGGRLVLCSTSTYPESVLDAIEQHACTGFAGVPSTYHLLLRASSLRTRALPSLRHLQQAGGKLPPSVVEELVAAQPGARVFLMYGQTEATARLSYLPPSEVLTRPGSIGRGVPGVRLRVVDESGADVRPGEVGEIYASGPSIARGYWRAPAASAAKFVDGGLRTGDVATVDEDGYVYVVDRKADFIKSWGYRISSQEVEAALMRMPELVSAAVVGAPDDRAGEAIVAFCALRAGAALTAADVLRFCRQQLARHMVPHRVVFLESLPLNPNGKVTKAVLRSLAAPVTTPA